MFVKSQKNVSDVRHGQEESGMFLSCSLEVTATFDCNFHTNCR